MCADRAPAQYVLRQNQGWTTDTARVVNHKAGAEGYRLERGTRDHCAQITDVSFPVRGGITATSGCQLPGAHTRMQAYGTDHGKQRERRSEPLDIEDPTTKDCLSWVTDSHMWVAEQLLSKRATGTGSLSVCSPMTAIIPPFREWSPSGARRCGPWWLSLGSASKP